MSNPNDPNRGADRNTHGTSTVTPVGGREPAKKKGMAWLWPLLGALLLIGLLFLLLRSCGEREIERPDGSMTTVTQSTTNTATTPAQPMTPPVGVETVTLPGGQSLQLQPATLNYELQRFLASAEPAPRRFTFDRLNFATSSAALPADAQATTAALAQILQAYPNARVRVEGYADARGSDQSNRDLGASRARAVAQALIAQGVAAGRIESATGGETNPVDTNATASGQAENRRTDLVVLSK